MAERGLVACLTTHSLLEKFLHLGYFLLWRQGRRDSLLFGIENSVSGVVPVNFGCNGAPVQLLSGEDLLLWRLAPSVQLFPDSRGLLLSLSHETATWLSHLALTHPLLHLEFVLIGGLSIARADNLFGTWESAGFGRFEIQITAY